ncbi:hypothetical protein M422DRAFT_35998 [Sphaerobolus stellatus SS14]|uniref:Ribosomal protein L10e/L16 domain-containing protein n=1 Tax=Sphaerobolus stellatus (strain SS14) TaxID=990650 RepID=A0A0C9V3P4_SPHS4|nr:hypothetical protein M422DRAFT_35998 [Sphaerobolus stellatus SS14]
MSFFRTLLSPLRPAIPSFPSLSLFRYGQTRGRQVLAPKSMKYMKRHKGKIPIPLGGSTKGTSLAFGDYGIRIRGNGLRLNAKQLTTAREVLRRKLKPIKHAKIYLRVFPDVPVCIKGNETRMGKGKGTFEFWATRVGPARVLFEIGTPPGTVPIREELARDALRQAGDKLPCVTEFITRATPPRLGSLDILPEPPSSIPKTNIEVTSAIP